MSLENYNQEGGVIKYNFYGDDLSNVGYKHYPSSRQEIDYFKKHQNLQSFIFNVGDTVLTPDGIGVIYGISNNFPIFVKVDSNILGHSGISSIFKFGGPLKSKSKKGWFYDMSELEHAESANYTIKRENQEDVIWKEFSVEDDVIEIKKHPMIPEKSYSSDIMYYVDKKLKKKKKKKKKLDFNFEKRKSIF